MRVVIDDRRLLSYCTVLCGALCRCLRFQNRSTYDSGAIFGTYFVSQAWCGGSRGQIRTWTDRRKWISVLETPVNTGGLLFEMFGNADTDTHRRTTVLLLMGCRVLPWWRSIVWYRWCNLFDLDTMDTLSSRALSHAGRFRVAVYLRIQSTQQWGRHPRNRINRTCFFCTQ